MVNHAAYGECLRLLNITLIILKRRSMLDTLKCKLCNRRLLEVPEEFMHYSKLRDNIAYFADKQILTGSTTKKIGSIGAGRIYQTTNSYITEKIPLCSKCYSHYMKGMFWRQLLTTISLVIIPIIFFILWLKEVIQFPWFILFPLLLLYLCCIYILKPLLSLLYGCILRIIGFKTFL